MPDCSGIPLYFFLAKVSLKKSLKCLAMTSLVARHLMNGVMNCIQVCSLCSLGQVKLAGGSAVLSGNSHLQVLLGAPDIPLCEQLLP